MASYRSRSTMLFLSLTLALASDALAAKPEPGIAKLDRASGRVILIRAGEPSDAKVGQNLLTGDAIKTEEGTAQIKFPDDSLVRLCTGSQVVIALPPGGQRDVSLVLGRLWATIGKKPESESVFHAGSTETKVRGSTVEVGFDPDSNEVRFGVSEGAVGLGTKGEAGSERHVNVLEMALVAADGKIEIQPFKPGEICPREKTQCAYAAEIVRNVGLEGELPANAVEADSMSLLASLGFAPCSGTWECEMPLTLRDMKCIVGLAADAPIFIIPLDEQVRLILEKCSECIFIQTRRRVPVSPFGP